jgi:hypothetical protein
MSLKWSVFGFLQTLKFSMGRMQTNPPSSLEPGTLGSPVVHFCSVQAVYLNKGHYRRVEKEEFELKGQG